MSVRACGASLVTVMILAILPHLSYTMGLTLLSNSEDGLPELSTAILQLTERLATMEVNLESRLSRLTDSAAKGETLFESLSTRLTKMDDLVEKVDALDSRLTQETSALRSTIATTNRDLEAVSTKLASMDRTRTTAMEMRSREEEEEGEMNSHGTRSWDSSSNAQILSPLITRNVAEVVERTLPELLERSLATLQDSLFKRLSKSVGQLQEEVREAREELENLGTETLTTATEARQAIRQGGKDTQDAVTDIENKLQSVHRDLALKITSSPPLSGLEPMLRQVNHSLVEIITRTAAGLNVTLLDRTARRRGMSEGVDGGEDSVRAPNCPNSTTVAALVEVKRLLQSLLRRSESLRRGLTKMTSEGLELLEELHQRFGVLVRRMNTDPGFVEGLNDVSTGQVLVDEMQELSSLVKSSYTTVMAAKSNFIDSCKRIQEEEPLLERKMTELLHKIVTNVDLGYQHNRQQLTELKEEVKRLGQRGTPINTSQEPATTRTKAERQTLGDAAAVPTQVQEIFLRALEGANRTAWELEEVEEYVNKVAVDLLNTEWMDTQKDSADQLVTAAKDLKGYAQEQILRSLDLYEILLLVLDQYNKTASIKASQDQPAIPTLPPLELLSDATPLRLPSSCTAALVQQIHDMKALQVNGTSNTHDALLVDADPELHKEERQEDMVGEEEEDEEDVPAWYTDPVFLSGNYGTPDRGLPVFREEDWIDMDEVYDTEPVVTPSPAPPSAPITSSRPGGVSRYFGAP